MGESGSFRRATGIGFALGVLAGLAAACGASPPSAGTAQSHRIAALQEPHLGQPRGLWVLCEGSQRVLERPQRVALLLEDAQALGVTDLFVQVYRGGRAWYPSTLADAEPYAGVFRQGGQDALSILVKRAHQAGLRVHAWVNVLSLARNRTAPILRDLGREAALVDQKGRSILDYPDYEPPAPDRDWLRLGTPAIWLDPAAPGVRERLVATFAELLQGHPELDGLHLDYIRYAAALPFAPGSRFGVGLGFGYGQASRARFQAETGLQAPFGRSLANANAWDAWRRGQLTALVTAIAARARGVHPGLLVSAAVVADRERAYLVDLQDWPGWLDGGQLDFAVPMLYTRDPRRLRYSVDALAGLARNRAIWVGLGAWLFQEKPSDAVAQLRRVTVEPQLGSALFSWDALRDTPALLGALATEVVREAAPASR